MTWGSQIGSKRPFQLGAAVLVGILAACGGGTRFDGSVVYGPDLRYRIGTPGGGWSQIDVTDNHVAWRNDADPSSVIQVNGRCDASLDIPLRALRAHLLIGFTERTFLSQDTIELDRREALRSQVSAKLDGVERHLDLVVLKKNGCVYDFSLIAASEASFKADQENFEQVLSGFRSEV